MLSLIMHHNGDLFIETPESKHPLNKRLLLTIDPKLDGTNNPYATINLDADLMDLVFDYFAIPFEEMIEFVSNKGASPFAVNWGRVCLLQAVERMVQFDVLQSLYGRNVASYEIIDAEPAYV